MSPLRRYPEFFEEINFTTSNEDVDSERLALQIQEGDRVLCVTASGSRPLELLSARPREIVAIDYNPLQSYLLELVMAAISELEHPEFLGFLGVTPTDDRVRTLARLRDGLSEEARAFWDSQERRIETGVVYSGRWERLMRRGNRYRRRPRPPVDLLHQPRRTGESVERSVGDTLVAVAVPAFRLALAVEVRSQGAWVRARPSRLRRCRVSDLAFHPGCREHSAANEPAGVAHLSYLGRYDPEEALPPYLEAAYYSTMRERLGTIEVVTDSLSKYLSKDVGRFDAYSVSDFSSYADEESYRRVWSGILATASPGARESASVSS